VPASVPKSTSSVPQISVADDIIAIKNAAGLVAAQFHGHTLRNARSDHVADGGPPEVVRDTAGASGGRPGPPPRVIEAVLGDALARPVPESASLSDVAMEEDVLCGTVVNRRDLCGVVAPDPPESESGLF